MKYQSRKKTFASFWCNCADCCKSFHCLGGATKRRWRGWWVAGRGSFGRVTLPQVSAGHSEFLLLEESSSTTHELWECWDHALLEGKNCREQMIHMHLAYFWLCSQYSVPKMNETKDQVKRSTTVFYCLIQPLGPVTHAVRNDALTFALDLYHSAGVTELLPA